MSHFFIFLIFVSHFATAQDDYDRYASFTELKAHHTEGRDYQILSKDRNQTDPSRTLIMAIHGCKVEQGTTELAEEIAGKKFSFYSFCGLIEEKKYPDLLLDSLLHVTSSHFDEPVLHTMTKTARSCLSIHGFSNDGVDFCVGGANKKKRKEVLEKLLLGYPEFKSCEICCKPYTGVSKKNPVNQCDLPGVQVEMSARVRKKIIESKKFKRKLAKTLRSPLQYP